MNVARSTFMRKGYLLTALAVAAVLLAASSGTAWAQTITASSRFTRSSGTPGRGRKRRCRHTRSLEGDHKTDD